MRHDYPPNEESIDLLSWALCALNHLPNRRLPFPEFKDTYTLAEAIGNHLLESVADEH